MTCWRLVRDHFESSQLDEACYVLYSTLADAQGVMPAKDVLEEAANALVSTRTLKRAKNDSGSSPTEGGKTTPTEKSLGNGSGSYLPTKLSSNHIESGR